MCVDLGLASILSKEYKNIINPSFFSRLSINLGRPKYILCCRIIIYYDRLEQTTKARYRRSRWGPRHCGKNSSEIIIIDLDLKKVPFINIRHGSLFQGPDKTREEATSFASVIESQTCGDEHFYCLSMELFWNYFLLTQKWTFFLFLSSFISWHFCVGLGWHNMGQIIREYFTCTSSW